MQFDIGKIAISKKTKRKFMIARSRPSRHPITGRPMIDVFPVDEYRRYTSSSKRLADQDGRLEPWTVPVDDLIITDEDFTFSDDTPQILDPWT